MLLLVSNKQLLINWHVIIIYCFFKLFFGSADNYQGIFNSFIYQLYYTNGVLINTDVLDLRRNLYCMKVSYIPVEKSLKIPHILISTFFK